MFHSCMLASWLVMHCLTYVSKFCTDPRLSYMDLAVATHEGHFQVLDRRAVGGNTYTATFFIC